MLTKRKEWIWYDFYENIIDENALWMGFRELHRESIRLDSNTSRVVLVLL